MSDWKSVLKADPTNWLLEAENPSVRYLTLKDIMGRLKDDSEVQNAKQEIMEFGIVPDILQKQKEDAYLQAYRTPNPWPGSGERWKTRLNITLKSQGNTVLRPLVF